MNFYFLPTVTSMRSITFYSSKRTIMHFTNIWNWKRIQRERRYHEKKIGRKLQDNVILSRRSRKDMSCAAARRGHSCDPIIYYIRQIFKRQKSIINLNMPHVPFQLYTFLVLIIQHSFGTFQMFKIFFFYVLDLYQ